MNVSRWDPFTVLARLDDEFDELVRRAWGGQVTTRSVGYVPPIEMATDGSDVLIRFGETVSGDVVGTAPQTAEAN